MFLLKLRSLSSHGLCRTECCFVKIVTRAMTNNGKEGNDEPSSLCRHPKHMTPTCRRWRWIRCMCRSVQLFGANPVALVIHVAWLNGSYPNAPPPRWTRVSILLFGPTTVVRLNVRWKWCTDGRRSFVIAKLWTQIFPNLCYSIVRRHSFLKVQGRKQNRKPDSLSCSSFTKSNWGNIPAKVSSDQATLKNEYSS